MVVIRLSRHGKNKAPFYRIVVADHEMKRDGRHLEVVGTYNTTVRPSALTLKEDRIKHWVSVGARPSDTVGQLINKVLPGYLEEFEKSRLKKLQDTRKKRKARAKARPESTKAPKAAKEKKAKPAKKAAAAAK